MPKPTDYDKTHLRNMAAIGTRIDRIFKKAAEEAAKIGVSIKDLPEDRIFTFDDYPATQKQIERLMTALQQSMETTIVNGVRSSWTLSNNKNNALVSRIFGDRVGDLSKEQYKRYFSTNGAALEAFLQRKEQGLNLSDRVWRYATAFKREIELGLDLGIRSGESAAKMTRSLRQYLQHPDKLFRRVQDKHGNLKLSKAAAEFHPGRGVYRSSYKNAQRLAATETNIAYRTSDHLRWQQMDFVVGIEIKLSNNHTLNGVPLTDICDTLAGKYPKDFKFVGWHPHCRCKAITVLKTEDEMAEDTSRILAGQQPTKGSVNTVRNVPGAFCTWVRKRSEKILSAQNLPYFIQDNVGIIEQAMGKQGALTTITVGGTKYRVSKLIEECQIIPTSQGKVYLHPKHGKPEKAENLDFARWRAEQFGEEVILLPNPSSKKSADSYNITRRVQEEYKRSKESNSTNAMDRLLRDGSKQADYLIIEPMLMPMGNLEDALKDRVRRCKDLKEIRIKIGDCEALYTREQIISNGYKIQPEDFRNASISRRWGSNPKGIEPGHNDMVDAKVMEFFGLNKKSVKKIAEERYAKRNAAAIQQAWNTKRIKNIEQAVQNGLLPKQVMQGIRDLKKQEQFNARITFLQKRAAAHAARTQDEIQAIKDAWAAKQKRDATTKLIANNVLKVALDWQEVDFSLLEKLIANNNLGAMREEAKKVAQAIKAMRDQEKALSDLIPDVHGWHKQFKLNELKEAHRSIQSTLDFWKTKYGADLASDSNLAKLQSELEQKIKFVENPGAFKKGAVAKKYWQVTQDAYIKQRDKVENRIEIIKLTLEYQNLLMFKTTSKDFKDYMAKAKAALDAGDAPTAQHFINAANSKKTMLEAKRKGKTGGSGFDSDAYSQARKNAAMWAKTTKTADKQLRAKCGEVWRNATDAQRDAIYGYTQSYHNINEPLRGLTYVGSAAKTKEGLMRIPQVEAIIDKSTYDFDMWLQRGDGMVALKKFGLANWQTATEADIMKLVGAEGVEGAFWSAGVAKGKGFSGDIIFNIYAPKGTKAMYCEPFSAFGHGSGRGWDGIAGQSSFGHESEILIQRGTKFRITKIERSGGTYYIDVEIIEQKPVAFPYVGGYPFN